MEEITSLTIYRRSSNYWEFVDNTSPDPNSASGYSGIMEGDFLNFNTKTGGVQYNMIPYTIIEYIDDTDPSNNLTPSSASELMQHLITETFFDTGSGSIGVVPTIQGLSNSLISNLFGRDGQVFVVSGNGFTTMPVPTSLGENHFGLVKFYNLDPDVTANINNVVDAINNNTFSGLSQSLPFTVAENQTPVIISITQTIDSVQTLYLFLFKGGKGKWGKTSGIGTLGQEVNTSQFLLIEVRTITPTDIESDPNAVINDLGDIPDGDYLAVANETEWFFSDSGTEQPDGGIKTYYFSYTKDGVLYFAQFVGTPGNYGGGTFPDFVEDDFIDTTNSDVPPTPIPSWQQTVDVNREVNITGTDTTPMTNRFTNTTSSAVSGYMQWGDVFFLFAAGKSMWMASDRTVFASKVSVTQAELSDEVPTLIQLPENRTAGQTPLISYFEKKYPGFQLLSGTDFQSNPSDITNSMGNICHGFSQDPITGKMYVYENTRWKGTGDINDLANHVWNVREELNIPGEPT